MLVAHMYLFFFFFNDTATTEIYTLSLHDALPIYVRRCGLGRKPLRTLRMPQALSALFAVVLAMQGPAPLRKRDRKSTRLNSSHGYISYAVFCLKKKKKKTHGQLRLIVTTVNHPDI